jgi:4-hydroxyproline epimerase
VLCPGKAYDRSPCGTGTSAKLACLAADSALPPGAAWVQESVIGSRFEGLYQPDPANPAAILPTITGTAHVMLEGRLILQEDDPFVWGIAA